MLLEFREPANESELRDLFLFRQRIYSQSPAMTETATSDVTLFDCRALHVAVYEGGSPIAYMRMVQKQQTRFSEWVQSISGGNLKPLPGQIEFPFENYSPYKKWNKEFLNQFEFKKVGEAGKLAIEKSHRSDKFLSSFIQNFLSYCIEKNKFDSGFGVCTFELERFYKRHGFYRPKGAKPFIHGNLPEAVVVRFDAKA